MDDFNISGLHESKNEWGARLLTILTPLIVEGLKSIFDESYKLCKSNNEMDKYLMTFQNFISRIPKWSPAVIEQESKRIIERSHCHYLEELITCVHIIQLKLLTSMRVGQKQKKIDINIPKLDDFIHKAYIHVARKIYKNVYLFEVNVPPLQVQKHSRELEIIIQECILNTIRDSIPIENILKAYMDETIEEDVVEDIKEEIIEEALPATVQGEKTFVSESSAIEETSNTNTSQQLGSSLKFNDLDSVRSVDNKEELVSAPKTIDRLEEISNLRNIQRKLEEDDDDDDDAEMPKLKIYDQSAELSTLDVHEINQPEVNLNEDFLLDDIEILV
uniref:Uncharacterized protein n=1 Tax=viral metagenome TaxID=1070528 RepID=A0A6C0E1B7_9ZZZZ